MSFKDFFYEQVTNLKANELKKGDKIENINTQCDHYKSKGEVVDIISMPKKKTNRVKSGENTPGKLVKYKITNSGSNYEPGDEVTKTEIQLKKVS